MSSIRTSPGLVSVTLLLAAVAGCVSRGGTGRNLCAGVVCGAGEICDVFTGKCQAGGDDRGTGTRRPDQRRARPGRRRGPRGAAGADLGLPPGDMTLAEPDSAAAPDLAMGPRPDLRTVDLALAPPDLRTVDLPPRRPSRTCGPSTSPSST